MLGQQTLRHSPKLEGVLLQLLPVFPGVCFQNFLSLDRHKDKLLTNQFTSSAINDENKPLFHYQELMVQLHLGIQTVEVYTHLWKLSRYDFVKVMDTVKCKILCGMDIDLFSNDVICRKALKSVNLCS